MSKRFISNCGSPIKLIKSLKVEKDGSSHLVVIGEENIQNKIQSFEESCSIYNLVSRAVNGDASAINPKTPIYGDFTKVPKSLAEMQQKIIDGKSFFDKLPVKVKEKFDFDFNKFLAESNTADFLDKLGFVKADSVSDKAKEKVDNLVEEFKDNE